MEQYYKGKESAYDVSSYFGRLKHFQALSNQRNFFYSDEYLNQMKQKLEDFDSGKNTDVPNKELWKAKYLLLGNYHMQTEELIPKLFRTSGYCVVNAPIIFALTFLPPTPINQVVSQTLNQSYNFAYNFVNGNKSNSYAPSELAFSYSMAVLSAIVGSLGTLKIVKSLRVSDIAKQRLSKVAPFIGVAVANQCNLFFSRIQDFSKGINVYNAKTNELIPDYNSINAAKLAFYQTAVSRLIIPLPIFIIPAMWLAFIGKYNLVSRSVAVQTVINTFVGSVSLYLGLTYALAVYPQTVRVQSSYLEAYFQQLKDKDGNQIEEYSFNKGL